MRLNRVFPRRCVWVLCILIMTICFSAQAAEWKLVAERTGGRAWINQLVIHPSKPNVFYAATEGAGIMVSEDGGATWTAKNNGLTKAEEGTVSGFHIRCLAIEPDTTGVMYAGMAAFGVFKTTDNGANWVGINELLSDTFTKVLAIHPAKPDILYLGTDGGGIYRRARGAEKWAEAVEGLKNTFIKALVMDPKDPKVMYVATNSGVSMTSDGADNWVAMGNGLTTRYTLCMAIDPGNAKILYLGTDGGGLFKTEDGGGNWVDIGGEIWMTKGLDDEFAAPGEESESVLLVSSLAVNPVNSAIVYAANPSGVFRSADRGQTWAQINGGLTNTDVKCLTVTKKAPVMVYAGTADGKLFAYTEE